MKVSKLIILFSLGIFFIAGCSLEESTGVPSDNKSDIKLVINEILASNDAANTDENDEFDDWFEIYNTGAEAVDIGGMYVTDDLQNLKLWQIPTTNSAKTTIQPDSFLVIWADGQTDQGVLHVDFKLSGKGEEVALVESNGLSIIDSYTFEAQTTDISIGRSPDGSDNWISFGAPTPGVTNGGESPNQKPIIKNVTIAPETIDSTSIITIYAEAIDPDAELISFTLQYIFPDSVTNTKAMISLVKGFQVEIGPFPDATVIPYKLCAISSDYDTTTVSGQIEVGYIPPVLYINEFMASNDSCNTDENGEYDDWIEIYNPGPEAVDVGGMYISDDKTNPTVWQIPTTSPDTTTIQPGGFLLLWADEQTGQGVLHVDIKLSKSGEDVILSAPNGTTVIDSYTYSAQTTDVSMGRNPDGSDNWVTFDTPTPGASNQ